MVRSRSLSVKLWSGTHRMQVLRLLTQTCISLMIASATLIHFAILVSMRDRSLVENATMTVPSATAALYCQRLFQLVVSKLVARRCFPALKPTLNTQARQLTQDMVGMRLTVRLQPLWASPCLHVRTGAMR